ncbi:unnamed protein product [Owenia fusiformis]|uniref:Uncharacterized protein n=1 Tax=Owenia fusiformis TaxID=6347 RepID=A0A8J1UWP0_OWEFU|nr:unnamed protein product [Owenia fusiformis]
MLSGNNNNRSTMLYEFLDIHHSSGAFTTTENVYGSALASMLLLWKDSQKFEVKAHGGLLKSVDFGNAGITKLCVTGAADSLVKVWDVDKCFEYEPPEELHNYSCTALGIKPQQDVIVTGGDRGGGIYAELCSWNSRTGDMITYSKGFNDMHRSIQYCPCGRFCCVRVGRYSDYSYIEVYEASTFVNAGHGFDVCHEQINRVAMSEIKGYNHYIAGRGELSFTPDCTWLVSNSPSSRHEKSSRKFPMNMRDIYGIRVTNPNKLRSFFSDVRIFTVS